MNPFLTGILVYIEGLLSFFNPCVLAIVPTYIAIVFGKTKILRKSIMFSLGFITFFVALGILTGATSFLSSLLHNEVFQLIQGFLLLILGIVFLFIQKLEQAIFRFESILQRLFVPLQTKLSTVALAKHNTDTIILPLVIPFFMGMVAALAMTPCSGPILGSVFALVLQKQGLVFPVLFFTIYAVGMLTPFLIFSFFWKKLSPILHRFKRIFTYTYNILGVFLVFYGISILHNTWIVLKELP